MSLPKKDEGLTVEYGGIVCTADYSYERNAGLESSYGYVQIPWDPRRDITIVGLSDLSNPVKPGPNEIPFSGELIIREKIGNDVHEVKCAKVCLVENAVERLIRTEDDAKRGGRDLLLLQLADVRYLARLRGEPIFGWFNVYLPGARGLPNSGNLIPGSLRGFTATQSGGGLTASRGSAGRPWLLKDLLEEVILPRLPGNMSLAPPIHPRVATRRPTGLDYRDGIAAVELLDLLIRRYRLVPVLTLDGNLQFFGEEDGEAKLANGSKPDAKLVAREQITVTVRPLREFVLVIGGPILENHEVVLEPCGETKVPADKLPRVVKLDTAVADLGLAIADVQAHLLEDEILQVKYLGSNAEELNRWAYRWYRLPGGVEKNLHLLPMLPLVVVDPGQGALDTAAIEVEADGYRMVNPFAVPQSVRFLGAEKLVKATVCLLNFPSEPQRADAYLLDPDQGLLKFDYYRCIIDPNGLPPEEVSIKSEATVKVRFAAEKKPGLEDPGGLENRYHVYFGPPASPGGRPVKIGRNITLTEMDEVKVIVDASLVERIDLAGASNETALEEQARDLAQAEFDKEPFRVGEETTYARPLPIQASGQVRSVRWTMGAHGPETTISRTFDARSTRAYARPEEHGPVSPAGDVGGKLP